MKKFFLIPFVVMFLTINGFGQQVHLNSVGQPIPGLIPGVNVTVDAKILLHRYLIPGIPIMDNPNFGKHPSEFKEVFGDTLYQNKFWPWRGNDSYIPHHEFIEMIYVELFDPNREEYYCQPAWIRYDGQVLNFQNNPLEFGVRPNTHVELRFHMISGTDPVSTQTFVIGGAATRINWDFRVPGSCKNNPYGLPHSFSPIQGLNEWALKAGDTWPTNNLTSRSRELYRDQIIDWADIAATWNSRGPRLSWHPQDHDGDGYVTDLDWIYQQGDDIFWTMSGIYLPYFGPGRLVRDLTAQYTVVYLLQNDTIKVLCKAANPARYWGVQGILIGVSTAVSHITSWDSSYSLWRLLGSNIGFGNTSQSNTLILSTNWTEISRAKYTGRVDSLWLNKFFIQRNDSAIDVSDQTEFIIQTLTSISTVSSVVPDKFSLSQNYPNPFNPTTKINFSIPVQTKVSLRIYDVLGKEVMTLVNDAKNAGSYEVEFSGANLASGVYFYRLDAENFVDTKKMLLTK